MLNFLHPSILFALLAGFIPLLIHLLNRRKIKQIEFSTIHFLKQMARKEMRRLRIRQILLLIIRTLIILLLVMAFARPTLRGGAGALVSRTATEAVIIIDNSLSLNSLELTGSLLQQVRQQFVNLERLFRSGDRLTVILGVEPMQLLAEREPYSAELWKRVEKQIQPGYAAGNLGEALQTARAVSLQSELFNQEWYLISDFQKNGLPNHETVELKDELAGRVKMIALPVQPVDVENVSVDTALVGNRLVEHELPVNIEARVQNRQSQKAVGSLFSLVIEGDRVGQQNLSLSPQQPTPVRFKTTLKSSGLVAGFVESESDALLEDNRYYFNFYVPENVNLLHITPTKATESLLPVVLKPAIDRGLFKYQRLSLRDWQGVDLNRFPVILLDELDQLPAGLIVRLEQTVRRGNGLIILPGKNLTPGSFNPLLTSLGIGKILSRRQAAADKGELITADKFAWEHPIFEGLFEKEQDLNPIEFSTYYQLKPQPSARQIISLANGDPLLLSSATGRQNVFLLAAPLLPDWTNLGIRGFVVPLLYRMIYYAAARAVKERLNLTVGQKFSELFRPLPVPLTFSVVRPGGETEKIKPLFRGRDVLLEVAENKVPGNYRIYQDKRLLAIYSVNHSQQESVAEYAGADELRKILPGIWWVPPGDDVARSIEISRYGRELWPYLLFAALLLLLLEMVLGYTGSRREYSRLQEELARQ